MLCYAKEKGLKWPEYAWIVHSITYADFLSSYYADISYCDILEALEGVILLEHKLNHKNNDPLFEHDTGWTYDDYYRDYMRKLTNLSTELNVELKPNVYANLLHD